MEAVILMLGIHVSSAAFCRSPHDNGIWNKHLYGGRHSIGQVATLTSPGQYRSRNNIVSRKFRDSDEEGLGKVLSLSLPWQQNGGLPWSFWPPQSNHTSSQTWENDMLGLVEDMLKHFSDHFERITPDVMERPSIFEWALEMTGYSHQQEGWRVVHFFDKIVRKTSKGHASRSLVSNGLRSQGVVCLDPLVDTQKDNVQNTLGKAHSNPMTDANRSEERKTDTSRTAAALFEPFESAVELHGWSHELEDMYKMSRMSSTIYNKDSSATVKELLAVGETLVASGTTANVKWFVSDSDQCTSSKKGDCEKVRTITIRGFDASDETVDRESLFYTICSAQPEKVDLGTKGKILVHSGLYRLAEQLYHYVLKPHLNSPDGPKKIVLTGHSIGGALSTLLLIWTTLDQGVEMVSRRILKVYTFGAPPVATASATYSQHDQHNTDRGRRMRMSSDVKMDTLYPCDVLQTLGLSSALVHGYIQPWDPITRLFSEIDPVYPLIGEIDMENHGDCGMVLWPRGPPRTLRPITSAILEAWGEPGWSQFRDEYRNNCNQKYDSVGVQHVFLPEPKRHTTESSMLASVVDIGVPPVQTIVRLSSHDLYPALTNVFPLDVFEISNVPQAIRSFVHHFYPAYVASLADFMKRLR